MSDQEIQVISSLVKDSVVPQLRSEIRAERQLVLSAFKIGATFLTVITALLGWFGWNSFNDLKNQISTQITSTTENYLATNTAVVEVSETLDRYHVSALISLHLSKELDKGNRFGHQDSELDHVSVSKLLGILCRGSAEDWLLSGAVEVLISAYSQEVWPRIERELINAVVESERRLSQCSAIDPSLRAFIADSLSPLSNWPSLNTLGQILVERNENPAVVAAVIDYGASLSKGAISRETLSNLTKTGSTDIDYAVLRYLARWYPADSQLAGWLNNTMISDANNMATFNKAFAVVSILFQEPSANINQSRKKALRDLLTKSKNIVFVPVEEGIAYEPLRWRPTTSELARSGSVAIARRSSRLSLLKQPFHTAYDKLLEEAAKELASTNNSELLVALIHGIHKGSSAEAYIGVACNVEALEEPARTGSCEICLSETDFGFVLYPVGSDGHRLNGVEPSVTRTLSAHQRLTLELRN